MILMSSRWENSLNVASICLVVVSAQLSALTTPLARCKSSVVQQSRIRGSKGTGNLLVREAQQALLVREVLGLRMSARGLDLASRFRILGKLQAQKVWSFAQQLL